MQKRNALRTLWRISPRLNTARTGNEKSHSSVFLRLFLGCLIIRLSHDQLTS